MKAAIVVFPGSNRERDAEAALTQAMGRKPIMVWHRDTELPDVDLVLVPGGFSYGDYLRCGAIAAHSPILREVKARANKGMAVIGVTVAVTSRARAITSPWKPWSWRRRILVTAQLPVPSDPAHPLLFLDLHLSPPSAQAVRHTGLDITVYQSDAKRAPGRLSHQGPELLRWALYEAAVSAARASSPDRSYYLQVAARIDHNRACLSVARKLCRRAYHVLRELGEEALAPIEQTTAEEAIAAAA